VGEDSGIRMTVFSFTVLLAPLLGLAWVRFVWQEAGRPGVTAAQLLIRTGAVALAALLAYLALRVLGAVVGVLGRGIDALSRRLDGQETR
jgi:hypothetical protein